MSEVERTSSLRDHVNRLTQPPSYGDAEECVMWSTGVSTNKSPTPSPPSDAAATPHYSAGGPAGNGNGASGSAAAGNGNGAPAATPFQRAGSAAAAANAALQQNHQRGSTEKQGRKKRARAGAEGVRTQQQPQSAQGVGPVADDDDLCLQGLSEEEQQVKKWQ